MSVYTLNDGQTEAKQSIADENGDREVDILTPQGTAPGQEVRQTEIQIGVFQGEVSEYDGELEDAGDDCAHCRTEDLQPGSAQLTEDEHPVEEDIREEGHGRANQRDVDLAGASQQIGGGGRQAGQKEGGAQKTKVGDTCPNDIRLVGVQSQDETGSAHGDQSEKCTDAQGHLDGHGGCGFQSFAILLTPELGREHHGTGAKSHADELEDRVEGIAEGYTGNIDLTEPTDHDIVQEVDTTGDQLLENNRSHQHHGGGEECGVMEFKVFFLHNIYLWSCSKTLGMRFFRGFYCVIFMHLQDRCAGR